MVRRGGILPSLPNCVDTVVCLVIASPSSTSQDRTTGGASIFGPLCTHPHFNRTEVSADSAGGF